MDGSGKSTVAEILREKLEAEGRRVFVVNHPDRSTFAGGLAGAYLCKEGKPAMILSTAFYIADVLHTLRVMRKTEGKKYDDFIFARYIMAVSYLPDRLCPKAYRLISKILPMPDVAVLVDVDAESAMRRISDRGDDLEMFETVDKLNIVRNRMLGLSEGWIVLDNSKDYACLEKLVCSEVLGK